MTRPSRALRVLSLALVSATMASCDGGSPPVDVAAAGRAGERTTTTTTAPETTTSTTALATTTSATAPAPPATTTTARRPRPVTTTTVTVPPTTVTTSAAFECAPPGPFGPYVLSVATADGRRGMVAGTRTVRLTEDLGQSWTPACFREAPAGYVRGLLVRGRRAWALAGSNEQPVVLRSDDSGARWTSSPVPAPGFILADIWFADEDHGWAVGARLVTDTANPLLGAGGVVVRATDGGQAWTVVAEMPPEQASRLARVRFTDTSHGLVLGQDRDGRAALFTTDDGGDTWRPGVVPEGVAEIRDIVIADAQHFWITGTRVEAQPDGGPVNVSRIYASSDGGGTWAEQWRSQKGTVWDADFIDATTGFVIGEGESSAGRLLVTTDGGVTWSELSVPGQALTTVDFSDAQHGWVGTMRGSCLRVTNDGGQTWSSRHIELAGAACQ